MYLKKERIFMNIRISLNPFKSLSFLIKKKITRFSFYINEEKICTSQNVESKEVNIDSLVKVFIMKKS